MPLSYAVDALLLDMDGTLVDSTAIADRALAVVATRMGLNPATVVGHWHGVPGRQIFRRLDPSLSEAEVDDLQAQLTALEAEDPTPVRVLPGAARLLAALPAHRWTIVTSAPRSLVLARLGGSGLPLPDEIVTADDVAVGKPDPEPYRAGAALLGVPPERCLAVEDAEDGLTSARAAGCQVLGVLTTFGRLSAPAVPDLTHLRVDVDGEELRVRSVSRAAAG